MYRYRGEVRFFSMPAQMSLVFVGLMVLAVALLKIPHPDLYLTSAALIGPVLAFHLINGLLWTLCRPMLIIACASLVAFFYLAGIVHVTEEPVAQLAGVEIYGLTALVGWDAQLWRLAEKLLYASPLIFLVLIVVGVPIYVQVAARKEGIYLGDVSAHNVRDRCDYIPPAFDAATRYDTSSPSYLQHEVMDLH